MKILMLTPYLPYPPTDGGQIRSFNLIKHLSRRHEITLFSYLRYRDKNNPQDHGKLQTLCKKVITVKRGKTWTLRNILRTGFSTYPFLVSIYHSPELIDQIAQELQSSHYDLIHAETFYVMPYIPKTKTPIVLVEQTINYQVFEHFVKNFKFPVLRPLLWIDVQKLKHWETYYWKKASKVTAVSHSDASTMRHLVPGLDVRIIPNGVGENFEHLPNTLHYSKDILYMGNFKWLQNWEAAEILAKQVFPMIKKQIPDARLIIAGQYVTDEIRQLVKPGSDIVIKEIEYGDSNTVVDITRKAGIVVAPIYGPGGTRLKIFGAVASMVPVVTTSTAVADLPVKNRESIMIADTPETLAQSAIELLNNKKLYKSIALKAKKIVEEKYTWGRISQSLEKVYEEVAQR